jgi:hypothetical protein
VVAAQQGSSDERRECTRRNSLLLPEVGAWGGFGPGEVESSGRVRARFRYPRSALGVHSHAEGNGTFGPERVPGEGPESVDRQPGRAPPRGAKVVCEFPSGPPCRLRFGIGDVATELRHLQGGNVPRGQKLWIEPRVERGLGQGRLAGERPDFPHEGRPHACIA